MSALKRFGLKHFPLPQAAAGPTYFAHGDDYRRLATTFAWLAAEPGLAVLTGESGSGKTAALRNLCLSLKTDDHKIVYLSDSRTTPTDLYRALADELGLKPAQRRGQLWRDLKRAIVHLVDDQAQIPIVVLDESHNLPDAFFADLHAFLNFAFDAKNYVTLWLVGLPQLRARLRLQRFASVRRRVTSFHALRPRAEREDFRAMIDHALEAAGAKQRVLAEPALEMLFRASRGLVGTAAKILALAIVTADQREQGFVDEAIMEAALAASSPELPQHTAQPEREPIKPAKR